MSKKCSNCGYDMPDDAVFCTECGTRMDTPKQNNAESQNTSENSQNNTQKNPEQNKESPSAQNRQYDPQQNAFVNNTQSNQYQNQQFNSQQSYQQNNQYNSGNNGSAYGQYNAPQYNQQPIYNVIPNNSAESKVVSTGAFFGLNLLFSLPGIGWIICIIMAFAPNNKNIKNYARSKLIWLIIGIILGVVLFFVFRSLLTGYGYDLEYFTNGYGMM